MSAQFQTTPEASQNVEVEAHSVIGAQNEEVEAMSGRVR